MTRTNAPARAMARPCTLVVVTGTGTEVGKTWVSAAVLNELSRRGWTVAARKPVQSFDGDGAGRPLEPTDADILASATNDTADRVCPPHRQYPLAAAPPLAAQRLGRAAPTLAELVDETALFWPSPAVDIGLVEGAGGLLSPLAPREPEPGPNTARPPTARTIPGANDSTLGLISALAPDVVVVVADAGLGVIHHVRATVAVFTPRPAGGPAPAPALIVHLNRYQPATPTHSESAAWLRDEGAGVFHLSTSPEDTAALIEQAAPQHCRWCGQRIADGHFCPDRPFDPPRHCPRCGRVSRVAVTPLGYSTTCRVHGPLS